MGKGEMTKMPMLVNQGAMMKCNYGNAPSLLMVLPDKKVKALLPVAVKNDHIPLLNILPFGMCSNPLNPVVLAATVSHFGVLTPMPCIPCTVQAWTKPAKKVKVKGKEALTTDSRLKCLWGGSIQITAPGQFKVLL